MRVVGHVSGETSLGVLDDLNGPAFVPPAKREAHKRTSTIVNSTASVYYLSRERAARHPIVEDTPKPPLVSVGRPYSLAMVFSWMADELVKSLAVYGNLVGPGHCEADLDQTLSGSSIEYRYDKNTRDRAGAGHPGGEDVESARTVMPVRTVRSASTGWCTRFSASIVVLKSIMSGRRGADRPGVAQARLADQGSDDFDRGHRDATSYGGPCA